MFPHFGKQESAARATRFAERCQKLGIVGVSRHSYRYAWAERARASGYPERFAQEALGHTSAAVHRAYAKGARMMKSRHFQQPDVGERRDAGVPRLL